MNEEAETEQTDYLSSLPNEDFSEESLRATSPVPVNPQDPADFIGLSIPEQFECTKPVLLSLVKGLYPPANDLHIGFMKGGKSRNRVASAAWKRGDLSYQDKDELAICIHRWMRRRSKRQARGLVEEDVGVEINEGEPTAEPVGDYLY